jgi:hypothetical protein
MDDPAMAFIVERRDPPAIEVRVNFGVFAGREATPAEIDRLAEWLLDEVGEVTIVSEEHHEIDAHGEAVIHQVRIDVATGDKKLAEKVLARAWHWARLCVEDRHANVTDGA